MKEMGKYIHFSDDKHSIVNKENNSQLSIAPIPKPPVGPSQFAKLYSKLNMNKSVYESYRTAFYDLVERHIPAGVQYKHLEYYTHVKNNNEVKGKNHKTRAQEEPTLSNARQINVSNVFTEKQPIDNITRAQEDQPADTDSEESAEDQQIEDDSNEKNERNLQCVC
ncbi:uncharacterized protein OCT59_007972 [Rhizophagus irregularis]|uniref:uncharacterized protein n=1 Tax=Rhizophagus irregularis TaxID=588596 RepID=UPI00331AE7BF|nr:hypothetical protein OCT59_007972 [Rhizophagus irregularis]